MEDYTLALHCSAVHGSFRLQQELATAPSVQEVDTFIVSDLHFGADLSQPAALLATLQHSISRWLILLEDILWVPVWASVSSIQLWPRESSSR